MGVDTIALLLSFAAAIVLISVVGRVVALMLKIALVVTVAWLLYTRAWPALKHAPLSYPGVSEKSAISGR